MRSFRRKIFESIFRQQLYAMSVIAALLLLGTLLNGPQNLATAQTGIEMPLAELVSSNSVEEEVPASDERSTRIRIAFGSDAPHVWQAEIQFQGAKPSQLQSLSLNPASVGRAWLEGNRLLIQQDHALRQNAYDLTLTGSIDAKITCRIRDETASYDPTTIGLREIRRGPKASSFGSAGRLVVERMIDDQIHINFNQPTRIYRPGETFQCQLKPDTDSLAPGDFFDLRVELSEGRKGKNVWQSELLRHEVPHEGLANCPVEIPLPEDDGVYRVKVQVIRPAGFTSRFLNTGTQRPLAERSFQLLVLDPAIQRNAPGDWVEAYTFDPAFPKAEVKISEWMDWRKYRKNEVPKIVSSLPSGANILAEGNGVELPPKDPIGNAHWQAYPISISKPGKPHVIEVNIPSDQEEHLLGLTLLDTNSLGELSELGKTIVHQTSRWGDPNEMTTARIVFWPRSNSPLLVISNPSNRKVASYGKIRVLHATGESTSANQERTVAIEWQDADLASQVGSTMATSASQFFNYADLQTHYESAMRIADRVQLAGANTAIVSINDQGASITPIDALRGTPRYDMGAWALGMNDLPQLDLLEILFHEFDRRGLQLIPNVSLEGPLPIIEEYRRMYGSEGLDWQSSETTDRLATIYNPLAPQVRDSIKKVGQELIAKYGKHRSLKKLAIRLDAQSALLQPNEEGGFDRATVDRFMTDNQLSWPAKLPRNEANHAAAIRENVQDTWAKWKHEQLLAMQREVSLGFSRNQRTSCLLIPHQLETHPLLTDIKLPRLGKNPSAESNFRRAGLLSLTKSKTGVDLALPLSVDLLNPVAANSQSIFTNSLEPKGLNNSNEISAPARYILPSRFSYRLLDSAKLFADQPNRQDLTVSCVVAPATETANAMASVIASPEVTQLIDSGAAAAGWLDDPTTKIRRLAAATPIGKTRQIETDQELGDVNLHITDVLRGKAPGSILTATNRTPWNRKAHITLNVPGRCLAIPISDSPYDPEWYETGQHAMTVELGPYEALAWRFSTTGIETTGLRLKPVAEAEEQLRERLDHLKKADRTARRAYEAVRNPSFEERDESGQPSDWLLSNASNAAGIIAPFDGNESLQLSAQGQTCSATSMPFAISETGQLAVLFHAYAEQLSSDSQLQIEMLTTDGKYSSQTTVRADQLLRKNENSEPTWGELIFAVDDLPLNPQVKMQIRFKLTGHGQINLDGLRCEDLMLPLPAYAEDLRSQKLAIVQLTIAAGQALEEGRLADCKQLLDSYWGRFLVMHFPKVEPTIAEDEPIEETNPAADATEEESPSVAERLRSYWPKMWR